jgi:3'-5' exonuclease
MKRTSLFMDGFQAIPANEVLFYDIETIRGKRSLEEEAVFKNLWEEKAEMIRRFSSDPSNSEKSAAQIYEDEAGLFPEYGRIISIVLGGIGTDGKPVLMTYDEEGVFITKEGATTKLKDNLEEDKENFILRETFLMTSKLRKKYSFSANGNRFDGPYLWKRGLYKGMKCPFIFYHPEAKPWDKGRIDICEMMKAGTNSRDARLDAIAALLGIPSPKDEIGGADVGRFYYELGKMAEISEYCRKDVLTLIRIFEKLSDLEVVE